MKLNSRCDMDILVIFCVLIATVLYYNTLHAGFVYDDRRAILTNPDLLPNSPWFPLLENDFWGTPLRDSESHGSYRPLCVATFRLNHLLGGLNPQGYHLVNIALHAACTGLVVRVARKVIPGRWLSHAITGLLFAVHPIHSEAVAGIVGRADLLACFLTLGGFLTYVAHCDQTRSPLMLLIALTSSLLAALAKETGISSLALCLLWEFCHGEPNTQKERDRWPRNRSVGILWGGLILVILGRVKIGNANPPEFASADNPTARNPSRLTRALTFLYLPAASFRMFLCPSTLSFDWSMDTIPRIISLTDPRNLESVCLYIGLASAGLWVIQQSRTEVYVRNRTMEKTGSYQRASSKCSVCDGRKSGNCHTEGCRAANNNNNSDSNDCCCSMKPAIHVSTPTPTAAAASTTDPSTRFGRTKSVSIVIISLGFLALPFLPASNLFFYVGFVIAERILYLPSVGACLSIGASVAETYRIVRHGSKTCGRLILVVTALLLGFMAAKTLRRNMDWYDEESLYRSALHVNPPKAYGNLGGILSTQGRFAEAEEAFIQALRYRPNMADVHYNLGILQQARRNYDEAILSYERAIHFRPSLIQAYVNLGVTLISVGRKAEAADILRTAASVSGVGLKDKRVHEAARIQALLRLGALYADEGHLHEALSSYREALQALPDYYPPQTVYNLLGETLSKMQQYAEAERWFRACLVREPNYVPAHITYGELLARNASRVLEAERWFIKATRLAPDDPNVHHRYDEAAREQLRAAELSRSNYDLSVAAASALHQAGRDEDAEIWYKHATSLRPHEARSHTNLGAILHLNGKYRQAAAAYRKALRLRPNDATTITNLYKLMALIT
ncbi:protein O-mannosyl-transferase TMTC2-like isoform X2 [Chelonus insularis]|uniref:protein O-mannosyl-transferase TMTC2-like isoform X2 n=1 Tax=Chelonus insularis TaxID=460826 RepID=UPI0015886CC3|nr:protein O-mannosyl-transferase TMTC2-like isoform X2 [Chelonus insularis]